MVCFYWIVYKLKRQDFHVFHQAVSVISLSLLHEVEIELPCLVQSEKGLGTTSLGLQCSASRRQKMFKLKMKYLKKCVFKIVRICFMSFVLESCLCIIHIVVNWFRKACHLCVLWYGCFLFHHLCFWHIQIVKLILRCMWTNWVKRLECDLFCTSGPSKPENLTLTRPGNANAGTTELGASWDIRGISDKFVVTIYAVNNQTFVENAINNSIFYTFENLTPGQLYNFTVTAFSGGLSGETSEHSSYERTSECWVNDEMINLFLSYGKEQYSSLDSG